MINGKDILALGWPEGKVIGLGLKTARALESRGLSRDEVLAELEEVRQDPGASLERESEGHMAELAREWVRIGASGASASEQELRAEPLPYRAWGGASVDDAARLQMETALRLPVAAGGALMADAHVGYGLPIGGVLAVREAVIPWAVGLDIACRLRLSVFELSSHMLGQKKNQFKRALEDETFFGAGVRHDGHSSHEVLDDPASRTRRVCSSEPPGAETTSSSSEPSPYPRTSRPTKRGFSRRLNRVARTWRFSPTPGAGAWETRSPPDTRRSPKSVTLVSKGRLRSWLGWSCLRRKARNTGSRCAWLAALPLRTTR
jgi:hypothetical protein